MSRATIQTFSGRYIDLLNPSPSDIDIEDIAHALSNIARFNGHTSKFYSVAQHCVLCSTINPGKKTLEKLLHDAAEAYVGDMVTPIKNLFPSYRTMEDRIVKAIAEKFRLKTGFHHDEEVKRADLIMLVMEKNSLLPSTDTDQQEWSRVYQSLESLGVDQTACMSRINPWSPKRAKTKFLEAFAFATLFHSGQHK